jgi:hypothetical protein
MSRKKIVLESGDGRKVFTFDHGSNEIVEINDSFWNGGRVGDVGTAKNLADAVEICKAVSGLANPKVNVSDE